MCLFPLSKKHAVKQHERCSHLPFLWLDSIGQGDAWTRRPGRIARCRRRRRRGFWHGGWLLLVAVGALLVVETSFIWVATTRRTRTRAMIVLRAVIVLAAARILGRAGTLFGVAGARRATFAGSLVIVVAAAVLATFARALVVVVAAARVITLPRTLFITAAIAMLARAGSGSGSGSRAVAASVMVAMMAVARFIVVGAMVMRMMMTAGTVLTVSAHVVELVAVANGATSSTRILVLVVLVLSRNASSRPRSKGNQIGVGCTGTWTSRLGRGRSGAFDSKHVVHHGSFAFLDLAFFFLNLLPFVVVDVKGGLVGLGVPVEVTALLPASDGGVDRVAEIILALGIRRDFAPVDVPADGEVAPGMG